MSVSIFRHRLVLALPLVVTLLGAGVAWTSVSSLSTDLGNTPIPGGNAVVGPAGAPSSSTGIVMADVLNVRTGPWGSILGTLRSGAKVDILGREGAWFKISHEGKTAFVHSSYIATESAPSGVKDMYVTTPGSYLNVRTGPWGKIIGGLPDGSPVEILEREGDWYVISHKGQKAYVHANYLSKNKGAAPKPGASDPGKSIGGGAGMGGSPTKGKYGVTSPFGPRKLYGSFHHGTDLGVPNGTPLYAVGPGVVVAEGYNYGGGHPITVKYDNGYTLTYYHTMGGTRITPGTRVKAGDYVGKSNNSGAYTTGAHLHIQAKDPSGKIVNPAGCSFLHI